MKNLFILLSLVTILNCSDTNKNNAIVSNSEKIIKLIYDNYESLIVGNLKGIEALKMYGAEKDFYKERINLFVALLRNDKTEIMNFNKYQYNYYKLFPEDKIHYFYWSRDIIDSKIINLINDNFADIEYTSKFILEYFKGMVIFSESNAESTTFN